MKSADGKKSTDNTLTANGSSALGNSAPPGALDAKDSLPLWVNGLLITLWLLLFGGRWLLVPPLLASGILSLETVTEWDHGILLKTYLLLLGITLVVLGLRWARAVSAGRNNTP